VLTAILAASAAWACGPQRVRTAARPGEALIVLLPDSGDGAVGRATVTNPSGSTELAGAREATRVSVNQPPGPVTVLAESDVASLFGDVLEALPLPPRTFTLYFRFGTDTLTDDSRALVPQVLDEVKARPVPEVIIIGHTDSTGTADANAALGLKRATMVRSLLVEAGLDTSFVEVTSHGEVDPLFRTPDSVAEPRNRRVEITVR
jgi:outer membrane protein OmpA-like peptidoglycan-associated protein